MSGFLPQRADVVAVADLRSDVNSTLATDRAHPPSPALSAAAIHEAAHELVALEYGCRDVHAFVRSRESGVCYHRLPPTRRWDDAAGKWRNDDLGRIRARAAVAMAGRMAESIFEELPVPDYEELLIAESADPVFREYAFEFGSLEEAFNHATAIFGDHHLAARWIKAALPGVHANTHRILKQNWPELLRRAHQLDQTLRRSA
jgi:hypothetical protein